MLAQIEMLLEQHRENLNKRKKYYFRPKQRRGASKSQIPILAKRIKELLAITKKP